MQNEDTKAVKRFLSNIDLEFVVSELKKINLSCREYQVVYMSEIEKKNLQEIAAKFYVSADAISSTKRNAVKKIYGYLILHEMTN